jgi:beta-glucosidase
MPIDFTSPHKAVYATDPASKEILFDGALEGHVLVKNLNNALPLSKPKALSIFGYDARAPPALDVPLPTDFFGAFASGYESQLLNRAFFSTGPPPQIAPNGTFFTGGMYSASLVVRTDPCRW